MPHREMGDAFDFCSFPKCGFLLKCLCLRFEIISHLLISGYNSVFVAEGSGGEQRGEVGVRHQGLGVSVSI